MAPKGPPRLRAGRDRRRRVRLPPQERPPSMESEQILRFEEGELRRLHLFRFVHLDTIKGLLDACTIRTLTPGEILLAPGEGNRTLYGVLTGRLRVHLGSPENEPLAVLGPGETAGELSVIDHEPTSAFVVADEPCRLLVMEEDILWSLVHSSHAAACNLLSILQINIC